MTEPSEAFARAKSWLAFEALVAERGGRLDLMWECLADGQPSVRQYRAFSPAGIFLGMFIATGYGSRGFEIWIPTPESGLEAIADSLGIKAG